MEMHDASGNTRFMEEIGGEDDEQEGEDEKSSPAYGHSADAVIPLWELYNVEAVSSARLI
jgi:hypothetical protein